jgi:hypothetical protein
MTFTRDLMVAGKSGHPPHPETVPVTTEVQAEAFLC